MSIERIYFNEPIEMPSENTLSLCRDIAEKKRDVTARRRIMPVGEHIVTPPRTESLLETHMVKVWPEGNARVTLHKFKSHLDVASKDNAVRTVHMPSETQIVILHAPLNGKDMIYGMLYYRPLESPLS